MKLKQHFIIHKLKIYDLKSAEYIKKRLHISSSSIYNYRKNKEMTAPTVHKKYYKLLPYNHEIFAVMEEQLKLPKCKRMNNNEITNYIIDKHPEGNIKFNSLKFYLVECKKLLSYKRGYHLTLVHDPSECQFDIGTIYYYLNGDYSYGYFVVVSFPNSSMAYTQVIEAKNIESIVMSLKNIFEHVGYTPKEMWMDNESTAVQIMRKGTKKKYHIVKLFDDFCNHYSIKPVFLNTYSGHEKGNVENRIEYLRNNLFVPVPVIDKIENYNIELFARCDKLFNRVHYKRGFNILEQYKEDIKKLNTYNKTHFPIETVLHRHVSYNLKVDIYKHYYIVPPEFKNCSVDVILTYNRVKIYTKDKRLVLDSKRLKHSESQDIDWMIYLPIFAKKPTIKALKNFIVNLPPEHKYFFLTAPEYELSQHLKNIVEGANLTDLNTALSVAYECVLIGDNSRKYFMQRIKTRLK